MFKSKQFIIGIAVSLVFFIWALSKEDLGHVWQVILAANYWTLAPALALYFAGVWVRSVRWRVLLRPLLPRISLTRTFEVVVIGYMANDVLPARIGELVRAYVLSRRENVRKTATLATILVERIFDGLTMIGFAAGVLLFVLTLDRGALAQGEGHNFGTVITMFQAPIMVGAGIFLGLLAAFVTIASSRKRVEALVSFGLKFLPGRLHERAEKLAVSFIDGLGSLRSPRSLLAVFGLSITAWLLEAGMYAIIGKWGFDLRGGDGAPLPFYAYVFTTALLNLSTLIPQAPGYAGVFEAVAKVVLVGAFGVGERALSYVLLLHLALLLPVTLLGFVYLAREGMSWGDLTQLEKTRAAAADRAHELEAPWTDIELEQEGALAGDELVTPDAKAEVRAT